MKMVIISFVFWILIISSLVASFLILTLLQPSYLPVYFAVAWFGIAFGAALLLCGPFWIIPFAPFARSRVSAFAPQLSSSKFVWGEKQ